MIKLKDILFDLLLEDTGSSGKEFEKKFIQALQMVGLDFDVNRGSGALWDIRPKGDGWNRLIDERDVNIKVARTRWMFGSSELSNLLPWDDRIDVNNLEPYKDKIRKLFKKKGVQDNYFLKPKDDSIQDSITRSVDNKDVDSINKLLVRPNFFIEKLGNDYDIRINNREDYMTSIIIIKDGKVFMRSERPRSLGGSQGFVAFKTPTEKLSNKVRPIKTR